MGRSNLFVSTDVTRLWHKFLAQAKHSKVVNFPGIWDAKDDENYDLVYVAESHTNRLVLFRGNVIHRLECGLGAPDGTRSQMRLAQTVFFRVDDQEAKQP